MKSLRIACVYFPIGSVGGIETSAQTFKRAAEAAGDTWHVLKCPDGKNCKPELYDGPKVIRGGDTYITVDGQVSHHPTRVAEAAEWLEAHYDALFFIHPCNHPTKAYGKEPHWAAIYEHVKLPKIVRFSDAHYETYSWFDQVVPYVKKIFYIQPALRHSIKHLDAELLRFVFWPPETRIDRMRGRLVLWTAQAKTVKGYPHFVKQLPRIDTPLAIFSNGVYYYNLRTTPGWINGMGRDLFHDPSRYLPEGETLHGPPNHVFYGWQPRAKLLRVLGKGWGAISMQGYGLGRREEYAMGSYNNSELEYLWMGCRPILHESALRSELPSDLILPAKSFEQLPELCRIVEPLSDKELKHAREFIMEYHDARKQYARVRQAIVQ